MPAKLVMGIYALAAMLAMVSIGYSVAIRSVLGVIIAIIVLIIIMGMGFKMKRKLRNQGLL